MNRLIHTSIIIVTALMSVASICQRDAASQPLNPALRMWTYDDGMADTVVFSIFETKTSEVLISNAHRTDFSRFDGRRIETKPLPHRRMQVTMDESGRVWAVLIGDNVNDIYCFDDGNNHWERFHLPETISVQGLFPSIYFYKEDRLFAVASTEDRIIAIDLETSTSQDVFDATMVVSECLGTPTQMKLYPSTDDGLWIPCQHGAAKIRSNGYVDVSSWTIEEHPFAEDAPYHNLQNILERPDGALFGVCALEDGKFGLLKYQDSTWSVIYTSDAEIVWGIEQQHTILVRNSSDVHAINRIGQSTERNLILPSLLPGILPQSEGGILLSGLGLARYSPPLWQAPNGLSSQYDIFLEPIEDSQGNLLLVGYDKILIQEANHWALVETEQHVQYNLHNNLVGKLSDGRLGFNAREENVILVFDVDSRSFSPLTLQYAQPFSYSWFQSGAAMLFNPIRGRIEVYDGDNIKVLTPNIHEEVVMDSWRDRDFNRIRGFVKMSEDDYFLILSGSDGPLQIRGGEFVLHSRDSGYPGIGAWAVGSIKDDVVWVGGLGDIYEYDGTSWRMVHEGFDRVRCIIADSQGRVWVASHNGVHCYKPELDSWVHYTTEDGLPGNTAYRVYEDSQGRIWASTDRGVAVFHPEADPDPPIAIIPPEKNSRIVAQGGTAQFIFEGVDKWKMTQKDRLLFSHRFNDEEWSPFQNEFLVTREELPHGHHRFEVRAMDVNWNISEPAAWEFMVVMLPWYMEPEFVDSPLATVAPLPPLTLPWYKEPMFQFILIGSAVLLSIALGFAMNRHIRLLHSLVALRAAKKKLVESKKMASIGDYVAGGAHEMNTSINSIRSSIEPLKKYLFGYRNVVEAVTSEKEGLPAALRNKIEGLYKQADMDNAKEESESLIHSFEEGSKRLATIVADLRKHSRAAMPRFTPLNLHEVLDGSLNSLTNQDRRHVTVHKHYDHRLPKVYCSPKQIKQAFVNLLSNAEQAIEGKGNIWIHTRREGEFATVEIRDDGKGVPESIQPKIFDPFFTANAPGERTGLGLSIAQGIVKRHGGEIHFHSREGHGATFTLRLPLSLDEN